MHSDARPIARMVHKALVAQAVRHGRRAIMAILAPCNYRRVVHKGGARTLSLRRSNTAGSRPITKGSAVGPTALTRAVKACRKKVMRMNACIPSSVRACVCHVQGRLCTHERVSEDAFRKHWLGASSLGEITRGM
eukprot:1158922-Pelagomonas_calceolata.AAC.3